MRAPRSRPRSMATRRSGWLPRSLNARARPRLIWLAHRFARVIVLRRAAAANKMWWLIVTGPPRRGQYNITIGRRVRQRLSGGREVKSGKRKISTSSGCPSNGRCVAPGHPDRSFRAQISVTIYYIILYTCTIYTGCTKNVCTNIRRL